MEKAQVLQSAQESLKLKDSLKNKRVIVVGDVGLDHYLMGDVNRLSPEAPVPILDVRSEEKRLGLSANVAANIASLGGVAELVAVVGEDSESQELKSLLKEANVDPSRLVVDSERPTTRKTRLLSGQHHIARVDFERKTTLSAAIQKKVLQQVEESLPGSDVLILQDYGKGVIGEKLSQNIITTCKEHGVRVLVDPYKTTSLATYRGAHLMTPNRPESFQLAQQSQPLIKDRLDQVEDVGKMLMSAIESNTMVITLGGEGMALFEGGKMTRIPTFAQDVFDVTGAGDTVIASIALGLAAGLSLYESCSIANLAAGVVVAQVGCVYCTQEDLESFILRMSKKQTN